MRSAAIGLLLVLAAACAKSSRAERRPHEDPDVITEAQLRESHFNNVFEAVQALHANWLQARGADSFRSPTVVLVYMDNARLGGVETLRSITPQGIAYIRHYDGLTASTRWGLNHSQGVIYVATHR